MTGGKTAGHIIPLLRIIEHSNDEYVYIGLKDSLEERICKSNNITFIGYDYNKKYKSYKYLKKVFEKAPPDVLISSGGFVSFIPLFIALKKNIKYYLIEENRVMGLTNKIFKFKAKKIFLSFPLDKMNKKMIITGNPSQIFNLNKNAYSLDKRFTNILVLGGSLGSMELIDVAISLRDKLNNNYKIILIAGNYYKDIYFEATNNLVIYEYIDDLYNLIYHADIIISRAGSSTIFECLALNKKLILYPSRHVKNDHQYKNSVYLANKNMAYLYNGSNIDILINYIISDYNLNFSDIIINNKCIEKILGDIYGSS